MRRLERLKEATLEIWKISSLLTPESHHQLQDTTPSTEANQQHAEDLNEFFCRFETLHTCSDHLFTQPFAPPATPLSPSPALQVSEDDVSSERRKDTSLSENLC